MPLVNWAACALAWKAAISSSVRPPAQTDITLNTYENHRTGTALLTQHDVIAICITRNATALCTTGRIAKSILLPKGKVGQELQDSLRIVQPPYSVPN